MSTATALNRRARMEARVATLDAENTRLHEILAGCNVERRNWRLIAACLLKETGPITILRATHARMAEVVPKITPEADGAFRLELPEPLIAKIERVNHELAEMATEACHSPADECPTRTV